MHLHVFSSERVLPLAKSVHKERRKHSWVEANAFVGKAHAFTREGERVRTWRQTRLHAETNVFACERKMCVCYTLHLSRTVYTSKFFMKIGFSET